MINISNDKTTIVLKRSTRNRLASLATKDQTFDDIVSDLIMRLEEVGKL